MTGEWFVVCETIDGEHVHIGSFEKRFAEQVLADIRNFPFEGVSARTLTAEVGEITLKRIDVNTLRLEDVDSTCTGDER